jgi:C1A family cysteine protease
MTKHIYNCRPSLKDPRSKLFSARLAYPPQDRPPLPNRIDLRCGLPVFDQGKLGSCTANALAAAFQFQLHDQGLNGITPSRLFIYFNERNMEGTTSTDAGASLSDGIKVLSTVGVCDETNWPYDVTKFADRPTDAAYALAVNAEATQFESIQSGDLYAACACLAAGNPFVMGITLFNSFESDDVAKTGRVPMPDQSEPMLGGHALLVVGYDTDGEVFIVQNSWSDQWGDKGFCYVPFEYVRQGAWDLWTIQKVQEL